MYSAFNEPHIGVYGSSRLDYDDQSVLNRSIYELVDRARVAACEIYSYAYEAMERACVDDLTSVAEYISLLDFEITRVEEMPDGSGKLYLHYLRDRESFTSVRVSKQYMEQHNPVAGGYYLVSKGGYKSYSPMELLFMVGC